ncbi:exodeoxyribonuclease VII large subunit [Natronoglycomyces albus]|uniref:exodeoxyribonuclease VII large subunit n=1 Tax=Natronoglycomyces albus TaxID=2811108 RepID=UPI001FE29DAA|nr:exodeoxyribonuclease VII large subunit [Natronoglycomyces albus]
MPHNSAETSDTTAPVTPGGHNPADRSTAEPGKSPEAAFPVRELSARIKGWIERLGHVWTEGQVTQINVRGGFAYINLRDPSAEATLNVLAPRAIAQAVEPPLQAGSQVVIGGKIDWYTPRGTLSLRATEIRPVGLGELLARLERLKKQLDQEGLFSPARKKPLPFLPRGIGLITGRNSDAQRDVLKNAQARLPAAHFIVREVAVGGTQAVPQVTSALAELDTNPQVDVIIIARGGGAMEDLLPFSDETLCRAVAAAQTPVVSAIGHEPDTPLLDFVADVRCSTPTAAGKTVVPDLNEETQRLNDARLRSALALKGLLDREQQRLESVRARPCLADPHSMLTERTEAIATLRLRARTRFASRLEQAEESLVHIRARVRSLSPQSTLDRGFAIALTDDGQIVRDAEHVQTGQGLRLKLARGRLRADITETTPHRDSHTEEDTT